MEITFSGAPPPAEVARALAVAFAAGAGTMLLAEWLRRHHLNAVVTAAAYILFVVGAATLLVIGLTLVYPHHHHDTQWTTSYNANYLVDVVLGLTFWSGFLFIYRQARKRPAA